MEEQNNNEKISVHALFPFKAQNTDELSFAKNDIIILTQTLTEGGWWEGTLNNKTGWFPSNYVEQIIQQTDSTPSIQSLSSQQCAEMHQHRDTILETLLKTERHYISELEDFVSKTLQPLIETLATSNEPSLQLDLHHLDELLKFHHHLSHILHDSIKTQHRIGGLFLQLAPILKPIVEAYCSQHAKILFLFNHNKDRILNALSKFDSSNDNNYIQLIKNLSLPVNRLEKYASLLKEYLYNLEEFHIDRGDAQRAAEYYAELASSGAEWRKRKEWELDIIHSTIHGLGSETLLSYGDALCLSPVNILSDNNTFERIVVLYPTTLVILSTLSNQQEYQLENRFQINQITISKILDISKRSLKINVPINQSFIISFPSSVEYQEWCEKFYSLLTIKSSSKTTSVLAATKSAPSNIENLPTKLPMKNPNWSKSCLRPCSPFTIGTSSAGHIGLNDISINSNETGSNRTLKRFMTMKKSKANEFLKRVETSGGDSLLLSVIEAYCITTTTSGTAITNLNTLINKARHSIQGPVDHPSPATNVDIERRAMHDMLSELRLAYKTLQQELDEEKRARKQLESQIQKLLIHTSSK